MRFAYYALHLTRVEINTQVASRGFGETLQVKVRGASRLYGEASH